MEDNSLKKWLALKVVEVDEDGTAKECGMKIAEIKLDPSGRLLDWELHDFAKEESNTGYTPFLRLERLKKPFFNRH